MLQNEQFNQVDYQHKWIYLLQGLAFNEKSHIVLKTIRILQIRQPESSYLAHKHLTYQFVSSCLSVALFSILEQASLWRCEKSLNRNCQQQSRLTRVQTPRGETVVSNFMQKQTFFHSVCPQLNHNSAFFFSNVTLKSALKQHTQRCPLFHRGHLCPGIPPQPNRVCPLPSFSGEAKSTICFCLTFHINVTYRSQNGCWQVICVCGMHFHWCVCGDYFAVWCSTPPSLSR